MLRTNDTQGFHPRSLFARPPYRDPLKMSEEFQSVEPAVRGPDRHPGAVRSEPARLDAARLDLAVVLPTFNERENVAEIIARLSGRRTCKNCNASFHVIYEKPAVDGICDKCQGELYQREDDSEAVITRRLEVYAEQTKPIIAFYRSEGLLITIEATGEVGEISQRAISALSAAVVH